MVLLKLTDSVWPCSWISSPKSPFPVQVEWRSCCTRCLFSSMGHLVSPSVTCGTVYVPFSSHPLLLVNGMGGAVFIPHRDQQTLQISILPLRVQILGGGLPSLLCIGECQAPILTVHECRGSPDIRGHCNFMWGHLTSLVC